MGDMNRQEVLELYLTAADKPKRDFLEAMNELEKLIPQEQWNKKVIMRFCYGDKKEDRNVLDENGLSDIEPETIEFAALRAQRLMIAIDAGVTKPLSFVLFAEEIQRRTEEATERWFFPFQDLVKMWVESEAQEI